MAFAINHHRFTRTRDHPDVAYLKQEDIGVVICRGLAVLYKADPPNPLEFLGNWLVSYSATGRDKQARHAKKEQAEDLQELHRLHLRSVEEANELREKTAEETEFDEKQLKEEIAASSDLEEHLPLLAETVKKLTNATGVYIGVLEKVKKHIGELDDENAHIDPEAPLVLRYVAASENSRFLIGQTLSEEEGPATFAIWKAPVNNDAESDFRGDEELGEEAISFVPDVVSDGRIRFFDVPRLGSFLAVPITLNSCFSEAAFDDALASCFSAKGLSSEQDMQKSVESAEDLKEPEEQDTPPETYLTYQVKLVLALDTIGQDRAFSPKEIELCRDWANFIKEHWERAETDCLRYDVETRAKQTDIDRQFIADTQTEWAEEDKTHIELELRALEYNASDELKQIKTAGVLLNLHRKRILNSTILRELMDTKAQKIVKFSKIFMISLYYFGVKRDSIVEPGTNLLKWKAAKEFLNDHFIETIRTLDPIGPKPTPIPDYAKTPRLQSELLQIPLEDVKNYSFALSLLYKFLVEVFKIRISDVSIRRKSYLLKKEERANALQAAEELAERRQKWLEDAQERHDADMSILEETERFEFNNEKALGHFSEEQNNHTIEIPPEPLADQDLDIDWEENSK